MIVFFFLGVDQSMNLLWAFVACLEEASADVPKHFFQKDLGKVVVSLGPGYVTI